MKINIHMAKEKYRSESWLIKKVRDHRWTSSVWLSVLRLFPLNSEPQNRPEHRSYPIELQRLCRSSFPGPVINSDYISTESLMGLQAYQCSRLHLILGEYFDILHPFLLIFLKMEYYVTGAGLEFLILFLSSLKNWNYGCMPDSSLIINIEFVNWVYVNHLSGLFTSGGTKFSLLI